MLKYWVWYWVYHNWITSKATSYTWQTPVNTQVAGLTLFVVTFMEIIDYAVAKSCFIYIFRVSSFNGWISGKSHPDRLKSCCSFPRPKSCTVWMELARSSLALWNYRILLGLHCYFCWWIITSVHFIYVPDETKHRRCISRLNTV